MITVSTWEAAIYSSSLCLRHRQLLVNILCNFRSVDVNLPNPTDQNSVTYPERTNVCNQTHDHLWTLVVSWVSVVRAYEISM